MLSFYAMPKDILNIVSNHCGFLYLLNKVKLLTHPHTHEELELNIIFSGSVTYVIGSSAYKLLQGSCLWLFPNQTHQLVEASNDVELLIVVWRKQAVDSCASTAWSQPLTMPANPETFCRTLPRQSLQRLHNLVNTLNDADDHPELFNAGMQWLLLNAWHQFTTAADITGTLCHPAVTQVIKSLQQDSTINIDVLCTQLGYSRSHLSRLFHAQTGMTIPAFRNQIRLQHYLSLLPHSHSLMQCALDAGFGSYAQFYRVHCNLIGKAPRSKKQQAPAVESHSML
jgi:AraC-like DNA-binding protein